MMEIRLLLLCAVLWSPLHPGRCSEPTHRHTPDPERQTENTLQPQLVPERSSDVTSLFITDVDSSSRTQDDSSRITDVDPDAPAACVSSCRDCSDSLSCSEDSSDVSCDAADPLRLDAQLRSFPAAQENASAPRRRSSKRHSGRRTNTSRIRAEPGPGADPDPEVPRDQQIPSFDEWTKIMMEVENEKSQVTQHVSHSSVKKLQPIFTNYASVECGAKILSSNPEAKSTSAILMENMDMYMLNPCNNKIWFIIELCQPIQVKQLDIANFEIFSSNPRDFLVSISNRYPTKKWQRLGTFHARDERAVQSFPLDEHQFAKYIKVDLLSHFGSEHFCPLSLIRVFGTSMMEEYEMNSEASDRHTHAQDDHDDDQPPDFGAAHDKSSKNLIGSAKDALLTMVNNLRVNVIGGDSASAAGPAGNSSSADVNVSAAVLLPDERRSPGPDVPRIPETASAAPETPDTDAHTSPAADASVQIVTLLPEDEDPAPAAEEDTERCGSLGLREYLLQVCSEPGLTQGKTNPRSSPVTPLWALSELTPSLTSDLLLPSRATQSLDHMTSEDTLPVIDATITSVLKPTAVQASAEISFPPEKTSPSAAALSLNPADESPPAPTAAPVDEPEARNETAAQTLTASDALESRDGDVLDVDPPGAEVHTQNSSGSSQKESVFMRLNNRIKALEMNMSLSGRYLEQLSQRYRKQVEEMQRAFNKTILKLQNTSRTAEEQDQRQTDSIQVLQAQLENVTRLVLGLSVSVSRLQQEVSDRQNYILLCLVLCVLLGLLISVNYGQMCESPAVDSQRSSFCDGAPSEDECVFLRRRASDPPSLSSLQMPGAGSGPSSGLTQREHCPVSKKKRHKPKPRAPETLGSRPAADVIPPTEPRVELLSDSEGAAPADGTLFCGIGSCARLCDAIPAPRGWSQSRPTRPEHLQQPTQRRGTPNTHTHTRPTLTHTLTL